MSIAGSTRPAATLALLALVAIPRVVWGQPYTVTDLGPPASGRTSSARSLNAAGQAIGWMSTANGARQAFLWTPATGMTGIGTFGGPASYALDIDGVGRVVGEADAPDLHPHAFLFADGTLRDLGTLGGKGSSARGINARAHVVGWAELVNGDQHAFLLTDPAAPMTDLGTLGGRMSTAWAVNDADQVVGEADTADGHTYAFVWSGGQMAPLGTLGGVNSGAVDVTEAGHVAGWSNVPGGARHAFLYHDGVMVDLGPHGGGNASARGINASDEVVGLLKVPTGDQHAFLYAGGAMSDLNDALPAGSGWVLGEANDIDDRGDIVGFGFHHGIMRAFLLTPSGTGNTTTTSTTSTTLGGPTSGATTTTSSTTVPGLACSAPDCDDGDPCTIDGCTVAGCRHQFATGAAALTCAIAADGGLPSACDADRVPAAVRRQVRHAGHLLNTAAASQARRQRLLVTRAARGLARAGTLVRRADRRLSSACRRALVALVDDAQRSAVRWLSPP